jgi:hypothetical protein
MVMATKRKQARVILHYIRVPLSNGADAGAPDRAAAPEAVSLGNLQVQPSG